MSERPFLSFVIPVRNDAARLGRCLDSIRANVDAPAFELIVLDNGSEDNSAEVAMQAGATVLSLPRARVSEARNAGAQRAKAELLAFVDADHVLDAKWLGSARDVFADPGIGAAGAPYSSPVDANWVQRAYAGFRPRLTGQAPTEWLGSGNLIVRRSAFLTVGGFDTTLESCEDVDLCNRLVGSGVTLVADQRLRSVHLGDPRTLRALFFGELWRGRDNMKVTLRGPFALSTLPSLVIPVVDLINLAVMLGTPWLGTLSGLVAAALFGGLSVLRAIQMARRQATFTPAAFIQNVIVAVVYDAARALALIVRATHRTRREAAGERAVA